MSRGKLVDERERTRAVSDLDSSLCVEAGAGTGKTTLLVDRYLSIVSSGRARCVEIVAITFTEKAAGEMKGRLRRQIASRLSADGLDKETGSRLEEAYLDLERAPISTIHAFAAMLLREHPLEAGVDPFFDQLDAITGPIFLERCWNDFLSSTPEAMESLLARFLSSGGSIERLREIAFSLYHHRGDRYVAGIFPAGSGAAGSPSPGNDHAEAESFREWLEAEVSRIGDLADEYCTDRSDHAYAGVVALQQGLGIAGELSGDELEDFLLGVPMPRKSAGNKKNWSSAEALDEAKNIMETVRAALEDFGAAAMDRMRDGLAGWFDEFAVSVERRKTAEGLLDFDDLLIRARGLLENEAVLRELRERYRFLLVDEFQDTDPLQAEIVYLLAGDEPGRLFVVGDPKQSIYRFRRADVEIYEEVKERLASEGAAINISQNFRSVPPLIDWINDTFSGIIVPPEEGKYQPRYEPIAAAREGEGPCVIDLDLELPDGELNVEDIRRVEAAAIGRLIRGLLTGDHIVRDQTTGEPEPLSHRHIAVIYPHTTGIDLYEEVLREEAIPYIIEGGKLYYTRQEVRDVASALWAIENPYDPVALVAILRSPLFGFSDEELFIFRESGGSFDYLDPGIPETGRFEDLFSAFRTLSELHDERNGMGPAAILRVLLHRTNFMEFCLSRPNGEQRVQNIRKVLQKARGFQQRNISFRGFARWLRERESIDTAEAESLIVEEDEDAVRLLTMHKAKGLQFPVVVLANLSQRRIRKPTLVLEKGGTFQFGIGGRLRTSRFDDAVESEVLRAEAESARLLYVAATRAGETLAVPRMPETKRKSKEQSYYHLIEGSLAQDGALVERRLLSGLPPLAGFRRPFRKRPMKGGARERSRWLEERGKLLREASRTLTVVTPSGEVAHEAGRAPGGETGSGIARPEAGGPRPEDEGRRFGLAFHHLMETIDLFEESVPESLALAAAERFRLEKAEDLRALAERTLASDLVREARSSDQVHREIPFTHILGNSIIEGRIDLLYRTEGGWRIVDFKTDDLPLNGIDARFGDYRDQGMIYALALSGILGESVESVLFFFVRSGEVRGIEITEELLGCCEERLSVRGRD